MAGKCSAAEEIMGSFIITLKTINRAGIYTSSWDPAPEQGTNPLCPQHQDTHRNTLSASPLLAFPELPAAKGYSRPRVHLKSQPQCNSIISILLQQRFQGEVCKELITGTT